jgi:hypothetical protein
MQRIQRATQVEARAWYDCPITDTGHHDLPEEYEVVFRNTPRRAALVFDCAVCGEKHVMTFQGKES